MHAKAFGLQAIDIVNINYKDTSELDNECQEGMTMVRRHEHGPPESRLTRDLHGVLCSQPFSFSLFLSFPFSFSFSRVIRLVFPSYYCHCVLNTQCTVPLFLLIYRATQENR